MMKAAHKGRQREERVDISREPIDHEFKVCILTEVLTHPPRERHL